MEVWGDGEIEWIVMQRGSCLFLIWLCAVGKKTKGVVGMTLYIQVAYMAGN